MSRSFIQNENAVNFEIGHILSLIMLIIFTGAITSVFYLQYDSFSQQASMTGFTDIGSKIARDITNMYLTSENSQDDVALSITMDIPLTVGGKGYIIGLTKLSGTEDSAKIDIRDGSFFSHPVSVTLNSINTKEVNISHSKIVYSGSGIMKIKMTKARNGTKELWIE